MQTKVSDQWKSFLEMNTVTQPFSEVVKMDIPAFQNHSLRFTHAEIYQIEQLAKINSCTFDDVVNDLLKTVYDCRFQLKKMKGELLNNLPRKLDNDSLENTTIAWESKSVLIDDELLRKTCLIGRDRTNSSNGEMPTKITEKLSDGSRIEFQFFIGSTVRLALQNYKLFKRTQTLVNFSN